MKLRYPLLTAAAFALGFCTHGIAYSSKPEQTTQAECMTTETQINFEACPHLAGGGMVEEPSHD
ncbi:hypothetical protein [Bergeriella denitrificans]|uniref:Lipoprotein n=1 Tax=Bergeriella denitrificans TaxID=494 RepID=A0A378UJ53_BERDE|nr:hypothetical protein [Bergeriella denitrificans]STZ77376.1 Uncharacterised protein [Bergeriella denitrificans]